MRTPFCSWPMAHGPWCMRYRIECVRI
jgi:hypothetical protein